MNLVCGIFSCDTVLKNCMKKFEGPAAETGDSELEFPDWSGMDDSTTRVSPEMAFEYCERYGRWFPELAAKARAQRPPKCVVEFVL